MNVAGDGSDRDEYARRARYLPGMLMLAPVGIVVAAAGWQDARMVTIIVGAAVTIGLPVVLESFVRQQGLAFEVTELAGSDGRWMTTQMMWPLADTAAETVRNAENRRVVETVIARQLPAEILPGEDAAVAATLDGAIAEIRSLTRDASTYPILKAENSEYGMWRNLRGVRVFGRVTAAVCAITSLVLIAASASDRVTSSAAELVVGLLAIVAIGAFWLVRPDRSADPPGRPALRPRPLRRRTPPRARPEAHSDGSATGAPMTPPPDDRSPLESPALGSSLASLIAPCGDALRPAPPPPATTTPIGVTLSGGGFRATFAGLGVIRYLADAGLLHDLRYVSSVSGGSVANGMVATRWATAPRA